MKHIGWKNLSTTCRVILIACLVGSPVLWSRTGNALDPPNSGSDLSDDLDLGDSQPPGTVTAPPSLPPSRPPGPVADKPLALEYDVDRPGFDYRNFDLPQAGAEACRDACASDPQCQAFTYVKPNVQGPNARCWLKQSVPQGGPSPCCVSGVKSGAPPVSNPMGQPPAMNCPPGTTLLSGQCVSVGPPPGMPPPVLDPSGHPVELSCPPGTTLLSGRCVSTSPPSGMPPPPPLGPWSPGNR